MRSAIWFGVVTCVVACGSKGDDVAGGCGGDACGGDLRGTWNIVRGCYANGVTLGGFCDGASLSVSNIRETGKLTFNGDGTFSTLVTTSDDLARSTPESCLKELVPTCAAVTSTPGACATSGDMCVCKASETSTYEQSGTYAVSGSQVTMMAAVGTKIWDFCAQGPALHLHMTRGFGTYLFDGAFDLEADVLLTR
ncbi:MAG: hypothetical protein WDO74_32530 [Pseudomonadota bacterium]